MCVEEFSRWAINVCDAYNHHDRRGSECKKPVSELNPVSHDSFVSCQPRCGLAYAVNFTLQFMESFTSPMRIVKERGSPRLSWLMGAFPGAWPEGQANGIGEIYGIGIVRAGDQSLGSPGCSI
jgi:hypothetical protein